MGSEGNNPEFKASCDPAPTHLGMEIPWGFVGLAFLNARRFKHFHDWRLHPGLSVESLQSWGGTVEKRKMGRVNKTNLTEGNSEEGGGLF